MENWAFGVKGLEVGPKEAERGLYLLSLGGGVKTRQSKQQPGTDESLAGRKDVQRKIKFFSFRLLLHGVGGSLKDL